MRISTSAGWIALALLPAATLTGAQQPSVDFVRDVQPIFQQSCYACHAAKSAMGGLRLDSRKVALNKVIEPGQGATSTLYRRITGAGDQPRMPMGGKALSEQQIATIKTWIDEGAAWPESASADAPEKPKHWAFVAPVRPVLPKPANRRWSSNAIDRFILTRLEKEELAPSPEADRYTLLRRLSLDLTGLPPTAGEVNAFLSDRSRKAYEKQVDRLLASPHYGEKWGRQWLDVARYADSDGYEKDKPRQVWFYRDWVINALNRDLPYDQFVIDQIAGDELPNATQDQRVATGFLRNSMVNEEGGIDPEQFRMEAMFDRMEAVGKGILGVTIQCAQCHDHKYDPVKQNDYYRMFAFLNNTYESNQAVYTPPEEKQRIDVMSRIAGIEQSLQRQAGNWQERMKAWEDSAKSGLPEWTVLRPVVDDISNGGQKYTPKPDGSLLAQGYAPTKHRVKMTVKTRIRNITAFRLELLNDPELPRGGPGRSVNGTGALTEFAVEQAPAETPDKPVKVKIARATADIALPETPLGAIFDDQTKKRRVTGPVDFAIDGKDETAWGIDAGPGLRNQPRQAVFNPEQPITNPGETILTFYLTQNHGGWNSDDNQNNNLGRLRLALTTAPNAAADPVPPSVRSIFAIPREQRTPAQTQALFSYWRTTVPEWKDANATIAGLWKQYPEGSSQLALRDRDETRQTHLLVRGSFLTPGKVVEPGVVSFLNPLPPGAPPTRLTLARWMVSRDAPTTARSMVNRLWQAYFGTGIVATSENLGTQAEAPSHPELLDWLAVEFMDSGWSLKHMHRLIVSSKTYRQSARVTPELYAKDPYNRLLARGPRVRVEAETVRDIALAASGLLNLKVGGPSVYPPAPAFLFLPPASYGPKSWSEEKGESRYRRALYTFRYRSVPYPMLQAFDAPNGDSSCVRRAASNTPLQALTTLNEPLFLESARALALRSLREGGATDAARLQYAFLRCVSRPPSPPETAELLALLQKEQQRFTGGQLNPAEFIADEEGKPPALPPNTTPMQAAAWTAVSRVLLNLDETITKE